MCKLVENSIFDSLKNKISTLQVIIEMMWKYAKLQGLHNGLVEKGLDKFKNIFDDHEETYNELKLSERCLNF